MKTALVRMVMAAALAAGVLVGAAQAEPMKMRGTVYEGNARALPAMKLVIRDEAALYAVGSPTGLAVDFSREMALLVCLGAGRDGEVSITGVDLQKDKIVVAVKETPGSGAGGGNPGPRVMVIVPRSELPVEGFAAEAPLAAGMTAESSPVMVESGAEFAKTAAAGGFTVEKKTPSPLIKKSGYFQSLAWRVNGPEAPVPVMCRLLAAGRSIMCTLEWQQRWAAEEELKKSALEVELVSAGLQAAYNLKPEAVKAAAERIAALGKTGGQGNVFMLREVTGNLNVESFHKFIESDGQTFAGLGDFGVTLDEVGKKGSIRWNKPYVVATRGEGESRVSLAVSELGTVQARFGKLESTDVKKMQQQLAKLAEGAGLKLKTESQAKAMFALSLPYDENAPAIPAATASSAAPEKKEATKKEPAKKDAAK